MRDLNLVRTTVSINGEDCKYTQIHLHQLFNGHHTFDVSILCPPLKGQSIWYHERESVIEQQGKRIVIRMKHENSEDETIFKGIITSIGMDGEQGISGTLHYRGYGHTILLESGRTMDSFIDYTLKEIVDEVVEKYGNGIQVVCNPYFNHSIPYVQMHEESGYEFLRRLAYQYGEWFYYNGRELVFGNNIRRSEKDETIVYDIDTDMLQFGSQILPFNYSRHDYTAEYDKKLYGDDQETINGINTHMAAAINSSENIYKSPTTLYNYSTTGRPFDINHLLQVEKGRDIASLTWISGESHTCRVRIGKPIDVEIPRSMCERENLGRYRVMEVTHTIDANGDYRNTFRGIPASMEYIPVENITIPVARPVLATVTDNADPESKGRIQIQFLWQESIGKSTNWIRVKSLDAGASSTVSRNRGFVFIPENGDQVLVDFELGDPSRPFVAGSLFCGKNGKGGDVDNHIKSIITRSGHVLEFNDDEAGQWGVTIHDKEGNRIHLNTVGKNIEITAMNDVIITAKENIALNAKNVNIIAGENINTNSGNNTNLIAGKDTQISASKLYTQASTDSQHQSKTYNITSDKVRLDSTKENLELASSQEVDVQASKKVTLF